MRLKFQCFGVHTTTLGAVPLSNDEIYVSFNCSIRKWSKDEAQSETFHTIHKSFITYISYNEVTFQFATCDWEGLIGIHDRGFQLLYSFHGLDPPLAAIKFHGSHLLLALSKGKNEYNPGTFSLYSLGNKSAALISSIVGNYYQCATYSEHIFTWNYLEPEFTLNVWDSELNPVKSFTKLLEKAPGVGFAINNKNIILSYENRSLLWLDFFTLEGYPSDHLKMVSNSKIWAITFTSDYDILLQKSLENYVIMDIRSQNILRRFKGPSQFSCFIRYTPSLPKCLWIATVESLSVLSFEIALDKLDYSLGPDLKCESKNFHFHEISCCGIYLDDKNLITTDLGGNVFIWNKEESSIVTFKDKTNIGDGIRSIAACKSEETIVFIGSLLGFIFVWFPKVSCDPLPIIQKMDSITCLRVENNLLCYSTVTGEVCVAEVDYDKLALTYGIEGIQPIFDELVHPPLRDISSEDRIKFGSLALKAEVWSVDLSPCGMYVASSSEDQTVKITDITTGIVVASYKKHTLAVTSVKWVKITRTLSLVISSSDDNTIVVKDPFSDSIYCQYSLPDEGARFSTITYLDVLYDTSETESISSSSIENLGDIPCGLFKIVYGTINGHITVRDLSSGIVLYTERIHQGSIEGLMCFGKSQIGTCSSDCTVQISTVLE